MQIIVDIAAGALLGDFAAAFSHWCEDTFLPYDTSFPILSGIAKHNELHHFIPRTITAFSYAENCSHTFVLALATVVVAFVLFPAWSFRHMWFWLSAFIVGSTSNLVHRFSHERDCERPAWATWAQKRGLIVDSVHHRQHHQDPVQKFAVVFPFTNAFYDGIGLWPILERICNMFGVASAHKPPTSAYNKYHDEFYRQALRESCPEKLTLSDVQKYFAILDDVYK